ncbi:hypothetical protein C0989_005276 [Termitomyces sp. Mn162]|nr:hypothetical protein C0989_005276 [Termitomyces sp. Mn162]
MSGASQQNALTDKSAHSTSVGPHKSKYSKDSVAAKNATAITQADAVSTVPTMVRGDWVLFHPVYTPEELRSVEESLSFDQGRVLHREAKTFSDKLAYGMVRLARSLFDLVSRYKHVHIKPDEKMSVQQLRDHGLLLDDHAWLNRILFLESIAGVPGMVAATLRHLTSLRLMDLEAGRIPEWTNEAAPEIAIDYWRLPPDAKLLDVLYAVRSDETTHRFVNHSLANLNPSTDVNPFALREPDMHVKAKKIANEAERYVKESHTLMDKSYFAQEGSSSEKF